jgi:hypothetical protein
MKIGEIIGLVVLAILGFVFPIIAAVTAFRKRRIVLGIVTLVATPFGFGWLVGIIPLMLPAKLPEVELEVKCPACGSTKGSSHIGLVDRKTGNPTINLLQAAAWALFALFFIGGAL